MAGFLDRLIEAIVAIIIAVIFGFIVFPELAQTTGQNVYIYTIPMVILIVVAVLSVFSGESHGV